MRSLFFFVFTIPYHTSTYCLCAQHIPTQPDIFCNQRKYVHGSMDLAISYLSKFTRSILYRFQKKFEKIESFNIFYVHLCDVITNGRLMYMTRSFYIIKSITQLCSSYKGYVMTFTELEIQDLKWSLFSKKLTELTSLHQNISGRKRDSVKRLLVIIAALKLLDTVNVTSYSDFIIISRNVPSKMTQNVKFTVFVNFEAL